MLSFMKATFLQDLPTVQAVKKVLACDRTVSNWKTSAFQFFLFILILKQDFSHLNI